MLTSRRIKSVTKVQAFSRLDELNLISTQRCWGRDVNILFRASFFPSSLHTHTHKNSTYLFRLHHRFGPRVGRHKSYLCLCRPLWCPVVRGTSYGCCFSLPCPFFKNYEKQNKQKAMSSGPYLAKSTVEGVSPVKPQNHIISFSSRNEVISTCAENAEVSCQGQA